MPEDLTYFKKNAVNYYGVFCDKYDKGNPYNDILTDVRKKYYESGLKTQKNKFILKNEDGIFRYNYTLNEDMVLKWKVFNEAHIVERVIVSKDDNYRVEIHDRSGKILKKCIYFGLYHNWVKTKYFSEGNDQPDVELVYWDEKGVAVILKYTADGDDRYPEVLYPCTAVKDTDLFQKITNRLGIPEVSTLCSNGLVYFAEKSISRQWNRFCANPKLLDETNEKPLARNVSDKTSVFDPVKEKENKTEPRKRIDLTQTYDVIVPNAIQADSVVINRNNNDGNTAAVTPSDPLKSQSPNSEDKYHEPEESLKAKLHSDSLLNYDDDKNKPYVGNPAPEKNIDIFDYLNDESDEQDEEIIEKNSDHITLNLDLDEDDDDNRILDRSGAVGSEPPQIFDDKNVRAYSYKKVRSSSPADSQVNNNPFAEYENEDSAGSLESIVESAKNQTLENLKRDIQRNRFSDIDLKKGIEPSVADDNNIEKKIASDPSDFLDSFSDFKPKKISPSVGDTPNKIIKVSNDEIYYYYGSLNDKGKRDGHGRTAMSSGMTAYDGGYTNDLRNGFGVYYYRNGKICYVGDWKNNRRNGVGISFNHKDRSMYVGGWDDDCPIGMGAKFDENGNLTFAGHYEKGIRDGIGMVYNPNDGSIFVSRWNKDKLSERGTVFDSMGNLVYNGNWKRGTRNGIGTQYDKNGLVVYSGAWKDGKYNGEGTLNLSNGYKIVGEFVMGKVEGYAVVTTKKGKKLYEGFWQNNRYNGEGKLYNMRNGSWCQGTFSNGNPIGILSGYSRDGELLYEGEWQNGKYHGSGICYENNKKIYEGEWKNGIRCGSGSEFKDGSCVYVGRFENNMRSGFGTSYDSNGEIEYSGIWANNLYNGIGTLYLSGKPRFAGSFLMGKLNGRVNEISNDIVVKECIYNDGSCVYMREFTDDGLTLKYEGHVKNGCYEGMGCGFSSYGEKYFEGIFKKNEPFKSMKVRLKKLDNLVFNNEVSDSEYGKFVKGPNYVIEQDFGGGSYSGLLVKGKPSGKGTILYTDHGYTGTFVEGSACGLGVIYEWDGSEIKGTFSKNAEENTTEITFANGIAYHLKN